MNKGLVVVVGMLISGEVHAAASAKISGIVPNPPTMTYGSTGLINRIDVSVFDSEHSNSSWTVTCRRSSSSLGWCANVVQGDHVVVEGYFTSAPTNQMEVTYLGIKNVTVPAPAPLPLCSTLEP